jgi:hypothetical protein
VLKLHGDLRLVDEHRDELFVLRDAGQNALERYDALEALNPDGLGLEYLGHTPDIDTFEEIVLAEGNWFVQVASVRSEKFTALAFPLSTSQAVQVKQAPHSEDSHQLPALTLDPHPRHFVALANLVNKLDA